MIESVLVVLSRPRAGLDDEFNDWYSNVHLHDALRFRGSIAAQRFCLSKRQIAAYRNPLEWKYLALYETFDAVLLTREHMQAMGTVRMEIALAFDHRVAYDYYFFPCLFLDNAPGLPLDGNVVMQQITVKPGHEAEFRRRYGQEILIPAVSRQGVRSGALLQYRKEGQMLTEDPKSNFVAIYRLSDPRALDDWTGPKALADSPLVDAQSLETSCWDVLIPRLTKDEVLHPTSTLVAAEEKGRRRMGDKIIRFNLAVFAATLSLLFVPVFMARAADDAPAGVSATVSDDAKAFRATVKHDAKEVADAAKVGAQQVAVAAKETAHEVAAATKEGAQEVAAAAKRGAAKTKAAVKADKNEKPDVKPAQ